MVLVVLGVGFLIHVGSNIVLDFEVEGNIFLIPALAFRDSRQPPAGDKVLTNN